MLQIALVIEEEQEGISHISIFEGEDSERVDAAARAEFERERNKYLTDLYGSVERGKDFCHEDDGWDFVTDRIFRSRDRDFIIRVRRTDEEGFRLRVVRV